MEERAKATPNGHLRRSSSRISRCEPQWAWPRRLANLLSFRYSQCNPFLFLASQNPSLRLLGKDQIREAWAQLPQGKWREKIRQLPEQRIQTRGMIEACKKGNRTPLQRLLPIRFWSRTQAADQEKPPPRRRTSKAHCRWIIAWSLRRNPQRIWWLKCKVMRPKRLA